MRIAVTIALLIILSGSAGIGQSLKSDSLFVPGGVKQYKFNLDKPAKELENLQYENTGEPLKGTLSPGGTQVLMDNYKKGQRIKATVKYDDGTQENITRSPCYIDPVKFEL